MLFEYLAALCAGIATSCIFLIVLDFMEKIQVERKIREEVKQLPVMFRLVLPFKGNVGFIVKQPYFDSMRHQVDDLLTMAGYDQSISSGDFIAVRLILTFIGLGFMSLSIFISSPTVGVLTVLLLFAYPMLWLKNTVKQRHLQIQKALPNLLDLLTLSVEAGKDFLTALRDILERRSKDPLGEELSRTFREIQLGKQRRQALKDLSNRVKQVDLTSVLNAIIQADELGVSIGQLLRIQGDQFRTKRFQRAEKLANEAPVKILFPVVLFIFPSVFIILMGPVILQAFKTLLK